MGRTMRWSFSWRSRFERPFTNAAPLPSLSLSSSRGTVTSSCATSSLIQRQLLALEGGFGQEPDQDTGLADLEEDVTARLRANAGDTGADGLRSPVHPPFNPVPPARHSPGPGRESSAPLSGPAVPARLRF